METGQKRTMQRTEKLAFSQELPRAVIVHDGNLPEGAVSLLV